MKNDPKNLKSTSAPSLETVNEHPERKRIPISLLNFFRPMIMLHIDSNSPILAIRNLLIKDSNDRTARAINKVLKFLRDLSFFKTFELLQGTDSLIALCQTMSYGFFEAGSFIYKKGDSISQFYVLIDGAVARHNENEISYEFHKGDSFGEKPSQKIKPLKCLTDCHCAIIEISAYKNIIDKAKQLKTNEVIRFLQGIPGLEALTEKNLQKLYYFFTEKEYKQKQIVFKEGEEANDVFIVRSGEFLISKKLKIDLSSKKSKNREAEIALVGPGELIGEEDISNDHLRTFTCKCKSDSGILLSISKDLFMRKIIKNEEMTNALTERIRMKGEMRSQLTDSISSVEQRKLGIEVKWEIPIEKPIIKTKIPDILKPRKKYSDVPHICKNVHTLKIVEKELVRRESMSPGRVYSPARRIPAVRAEISRNQFISTGLSPSKSHSRRSSMELPINFHTTILREQLASAQSNKRFYFNNLGLSRHSSHLSLSQFYSGNSTDRSSSKNSKRMLKTSHNMFRFKNL
ncbi:unnamed protein product [Blepharisma stoltei]|uniref:Cyclic nucleotide-binding domain-containing protein n=1 Tax=Blepharisma stoltei TaxID=1481888 RepID=A0AAU9IT43_9CILI|nr:unnamed protein product [Blepharisma stoltei]